MVDRTTMKAEIQQLAKTGEQLWEREVLAAATEAERKQYLATVKDEAERKRLARKPEFTSEYQKWYSQALRVVEQLLPDRYSEFRNFYLDERRKSMESSNYGIADYARGSRPRVMTKESASNKALAHFRQQVSILQTAEDRLDSILTNIGRSLHSEILDDELDAARSLLAASHVRSAGVVAGVALEGHLKKLIADHKVPFRKKAMLGNLNEALKDAGVYDVPQWRRIQYLTDVRNLCGHKGEREPKREEVQDLIDETAKIVKTLF